MFLTFRPINGKQQKHHSCDLKVLFLFLISYFDLNYSKLLEKLLNNFTYHRKMTLEVFLTFYDVGRMTFYLTFITTIITKNTHKKKNIYNNNSYDLNIYYLY